MRPDNDRPAERKRRARSNISEPPTSSKKEYLCIDALVDWARFYVDQAWPIFPLHWIEYESCACPRGSECTNAGKHPRNRNGFYGATTDMRIVLSWFGKMHTPNLGIATGGPQELVVIDIDPRHDGYQTLRLLKKRFGVLPRTYTVKTGSGGLHLYFSMEGVDPPIGNSAGKLGPGIDVRGKGGYVVAPPSETLLGAYTVEIAAPLAPIPGWVVDLLRAPRKPLCRVMDPRLSSPKSAGGVGETPQNLDQAVLVMLGAVDGNRNHTLNCMAFWAGRRIARCLVSEDEAVHRLTLAAELTGLDHDEIERTLWSGLTAGMDEG